MMQKKSPWFVIQYKALFFISLTSCEGLNMVSKAGTNGPQLNVRFRRTRGSSNEKLIGWKSSRASPGNGMAR
jgi:hypothetical protein